MDSYQEPPSHTMIRALNEGDIFPKHGWAKASEDASPELVLPFVGHVHEYADKLRRDESPHKDGFVQARLAFQERLLFYFMSLDLYANSLTNFLNRPHHAYLHTDLALYNFDCLLDDTAKLLRFFVSDRPDQPKHKSFDTFKTWLSKNNCLPGASHIQEAFSRLADAEWYQSWQKSAGGKSPRDQRTHQQWSHFAVTLIRGDEALVSQQLSKGRQKLTGLQGFLQEVTTGFLELLAALTPSTIESYGTCDIFLNHFGLSPDHRAEFLGGRWLPTFVPALLTTQQP